ncbi:hypothetical protein OJAV_G00038530 [Oryzias javanicus]|uniref:Uncharacterized protein n=1 Tax=Oryzias javanicus TaxID=123683 RepID=A0A437DGK5_ORYJA|nr:hypothetical protein OJAV_G00038530 [Oryzias javanicus]
MYFFVEFFIYLRRVSLWRRRVPLTELRAQLRSEQLRPDRNEEINSDGIGLFLFSSGFGFLRCEGGFYWRGGLTAGVMGQRSL